jgi:ornithine cyclodeaminase/alanine dehydrogenase-like protein (mu-crystallin family)
MKARYSQRRRLRVAILLTDSDLADLIPMADAIALTEQYYLDNGDGQARYHSPTRLKIPAGSLRITSGALLADHVMGARVGPASGLRGDTTVMSLFDTESGRLLAVLAYPYSVLRTGANIGLAVKWLTPPDAATVALIGTGRNARSLLRGIAAVRPVKSAAVYSRQPDKRARFADEVAAEFDGIEVRAAGSSADAAAGAQIVVCATNSAVPVLERTRWGRTRSSPRWAARLSCPLSCCSAQPRSSLPRGRRSASTTTTTPTARTLPPGCWSA